MSSDQLKVKCTEISSLLSTPRHNGKNLSSSQEIRLFVPWFEHRKGRITASKAHKVYQRKLTTPLENLVKRDISTTKQVKWGIDNEEKKARHTAGLDTRKNGTFARQISQRFST